MLRHPTFEKCSEDYSFLTFLLPNVLFATAACKVATSDLRKVLRGLQFFNILTSKCAFRHRGVQFFDMWTSKSAPKMTCFVHFNFQMRFSPQRRAIFRHLNLKKVLRTRHVLHIFTSECAFRHSGVQFLISPLTTCLRTRRFNRPTFGLTRHTNHRENTAFRDFSNIWRGCIFFLPTWLPVSSAFQLSILSEVCYLNFLRLLLLLLFCRYLSLGLSMCMFVSAGSSPLHQDHSWHSLLARTAPGAPDLPFAAKW